MPRDDLEKLLGGYATNTLTEEERKALFEAALTDQALFNALADEQAMKDLLDDPRSRRQLMAALEAKEKKKAWFQQPWSWALAGSLAATVLAVTLVLREAGFPPPVQPERFETSKQQAATEPKAGDSASNLQAKREAKAQRARAVPAKPPQTADRPTPTVSAPAARDEPSAVADAPLQDSMEQLRERPARELFYAGVEPPRAPHSLKAATEQESGELQKGTAEAKKLDKTARALGMARASLMPLGLRYSIAEHRLTIEANDSAYLYVLGRNAAGTLIPLFLGKGAGGEAARVEKRKRYTVEAPPDVSQVVIMLSRQPRTDLQGAPASPLSTTTSLLIEKVEEGAPSQGSETVVYVVNPRSDPSAGIVFETSLATR